MVCARWLSGAAVLIALTALTSAETPTTVTTRPPSKRLLSKVCRQTCGAVIANCAAHGGHRGKCKRHVLARCRREGLAACSTTTTALTTTTTTETTTTAPTTTTTIPSPLAVLLGNWTFTVLEPSYTWYPRYSLDSVQPAPGGSYDVVVGTNLDWGNTVVVGRAQDIAPGTQFAGEFVLRDPENSSACAEFFFDIVGGSLSGEVIALDGACETRVSDLSFPFTGERL
jgi:hypothetical protein